MKLVSFRTHDGYEGYGIHDGNGVIDIKQRVAPNLVDLKHFIAECGTEAANLFLGEQIDFHEEEIRYLPVINKPEKIICVGMNYQDKRIEFGATNPAPTLFIRFADSQTAHNEEVIKPFHTEQLDYEGELAIIVGKTCSHVSPDQVPGVVAGYSCYMDGSVRDWQHTWFTAGKNWKKTGSFGPWLVTKDEVPNPQNLSIKTWLNGVMVQNASTQSMIHSINELVSYISTFTELSAGDVILTGSPGGVGKSRVPPLFMQVGDTIEVEIEKIGRLKNHIASDKKNNTTNPEFSHSIIN